MGGFVGRERELAALRKLLTEVDKDGRAVLIRGRRRVGKSRLVEEFLRRNNVPAVYFTASAQPSIAIDIGRFMKAARHSTLPGAHVLDGQSPAGWDAALTLLAKALPADHPSVVVLDEMPYLIANDPGFEGALRRLFDRKLVGLPVLLICIGSDLAVMEALNFHQRAIEMVIPTLSPADVAELLDMPAAQAFDAHLISGGLPLILDDWPRGADIFDYLAEATADPTSALIVSGERSLAAEFPADAQARLVLGAIGSGERTYSLVGRAAADMAKGSLTRALGLLSAKRIIDIALPLSTSPSRETRYTVADAHLRFWLAFLGPYLPEIERGRGDQTLKRIRAQWTSWHGRAIEPVIRESLRRLPEGVLPEGTNSIGGYWTRSNHPEIDIVGADREPIAKRLTLVGSIKWQENRAFDTRDLAALAVQRSALPGADDTTEFLVVSRSGSTVESVLHLTPEQLLQAWR